MTPAIAVRKDLRLHAQLRQRRVWGNGHERAPSFTDGPCEPNRLRPLGLRSIEHHEREPSAPEQLFGTLESVLPALRLDEVRSILPERAADGPSRVDPDGTLTIRHGRATSRTQHCTCTT